MRNLTTHLVLPIILFFFFTVRSQSGINPSMAIALQNSINSLRMNMQLKGISAAAYVPGQGMWKGVTGVSHDTIQIDTTTLFSIGSITKTFIAAEIFKLIENGLLSLSDSVYALLPPMQNVNPNITVKHLLGHKSGLADYVNGNWQSAMNANPNQIWYQPAAVNAFLPAPLGLPGGSYKYINTNYALLGMIIEAKTGDSLHKVLRDNLLTPLSLNNTHMEVFETYTNSIAHNWSAPNFNPALATDESATPHNALWSSVSAAGGYFSDPADLAKWGYNLYSGNVLNATSLSQMLSFTNVSGSSYFNGYGLGVQRFPGNGRTYWGHAGNYFGYAACMLYYPQDSICVAVLINQDCYGANVAKPVIDAAIINAAVGIKEMIGGRGAVIYPNPSDASVTIRVEEGTYSLEFADALGKVVLATQFSGSEYEINSENLSNGVYYLKLTSDKKSFSEKIIVVHN
jgi:CubicO group peptidase (beta-lactamase class C family)